MTLSTTTRNAMLAALTALLNSGTIVFQTSGDNEVATCTFGATAFGTPSSGSASANAITDDTSATGGTIAKGKLMKSDGSTLVADITVTATGGGGDIELSSLAIGAGDTVSITSLTATQPA